MIRIHLGLGLKPSKYLTNTNTLHNHIYIYVYNRWEVFTGGGGSVDNLRKEKMVSVFV